MNTYLAQLTPMEQQVLQIAAAHLETSFSLVKSIGYQEWQKAQAPPQTQAPPTKAPQQAQQQAQAPKVPTQAPPTQAQPIQAPPIPAPKKRIIIVKKKC